MKETRDGIQERLTDNCLFMREYDLFGIPLLFGPSLPLNQSVVAVVVKVFATDVHSDRLNVFKKSDWQKAVMYQHVFRVDLRTRCEDLLYAACNLWGFRRNQVELFQVYDDGVYG